MNLETEQIYLLNPPGSQSAGDMAGAQQKLEVPVAQPVNLENVCDFSSVCRVCATIMEYMIPIFSGEGLQNNLADKIHKHLPIQVSEQDALPQWVCYQCCCTLLAWHELVACATQADHALRTRLLQLTPQVQEQQTAPPLTLNTEQEIQDLETNKEEKEFSLLELELLPTPSPPPAYPSTTPRTCEYCPQLLTHSYKEHLIDAHSDLLFHCDECDTYVSRKDFILHMSVHAVIYADKPNNSSQNKEDNESNKELPNDSDKPNNNLTSDKEETTKPRTKDGHSSGEFSDHSDMDDGFGPLPESVFEAIEDSQDSQSAPVQTSTDTSKSNNTSTMDSSPIAKKKKHKISRTCPICAKVYSASSSYFYHMKYFHKNSKEYECNTCGGKFGTKASLTQHMVLHSGEFQFECKDCHKKFRAKASLYIHEQTHKGVKSYACSQCQISFRWRTHLKRHLKRHSAEKVHICSTCGRGFSIRCDLLRHARTHTAGNHSCDKCGAKFAQLRYLKVHMDKKHSVVNGPNGNIVAPDTKAADAKDISC